MKRPTPPNFVSRLPRSTPKALDTPERLLEFCRQNGLLHEHGSADIEKLIISDPNLTLKREDLGEKDAYIQQVSPHNFVISVNRRHPKSRQRFSMAHEYAHYQLHRNGISSLPEGERILNRDGQYNDLENQANRFAAQILMPDESVRLVMRQTGNNKVEAARLLDVSLAALTFRLDDKGTSIT